MIDKNTVKNGAAGSFKAEDIIHPGVIAQKLQAGDHPLAGVLLDKFSDAGRAMIASSSGLELDPHLLAEAIANEFNHIVAAGLSLYDPAQLNGTKLRKSTNRLVRKNPQGAALERLNTLLIQDLFPRDLAHDSCELVAVVKQRGIEFRIYCEKRRLLTKWNVSYRITFPATNGLTSTHAPSLEEARLEINRLVDQVLAGRAPVSRKENKARDGKAKAYDAVAAEVAKVGRLDQKGVLEFITDAVKAQLKLGLERSLLDFVVYAIEIVAKPVTRCLLQPATAKFTAFLLARKGVCERESRKHVAVVRRFAAAMPQRVHARNTENLQAGGPAPASPTDVYVDAPQPNEIQAWLNGVRGGWSRKRAILDQVRAFMAYCRDALHALPPGVKTAAHVVPRPKPDSDREPVPASILSFVDVWRILMNIEDLESLFFFSLAVFAGLHQSEILRLVWEHDIVWNGGKPVQIFIASGKGKDKQGNRMGQHVDIRPPLAEVLALGHGRAGKIIHHKRIREFRLARIAKRLSITWEPSIMRHTFISNLFGLGFSFEEVARQARNTVKVLKRHYYAPIPKHEGQRFFTLPVDIQIVSALPSYKRFWVWGNVREFKLLPDGTTAIAVADGEGTTPKANVQAYVSKRVQKMREGRIVWPDDIELQVALFEKTQKQIGRELNCRQTTVSEHARARGLWPPKPGYFWRIKLGLPVEVPEAVLQARQELLARKKGSTAKPGEGTAQPPSASTTTEDPSQAPAPGSEQPEPGNHNSQPEK